MFDGLPTPQVAGETGVTKRILWNKKKLDACEVTLDATPVRGDECPFFVEKRTERVFQRRPVAEAVEEAAVVRGGRGRLESVQQPQHQVLGEVRGRGRR